MRLPPSAAVKDWENCLAVSAAMTGRLYQRRYSVPLTLGAARNIRSRALPRVR
jgi:hypothetical protein